MTTAALATRLVLVANGTATAGGIASVTSNDSTVGVGAVLGVVVVALVVIYARRRL